MAEDWAIDVKKYASDADDTAISNIVKYCGIALRSRDSSLVSFTDERELTRVKVNFLRKRLGLSNSDGELNRAISAVGEKMKSDHTRNRVTVYYLLAEHFGKLSLFGGALKSRKTDAREGQKTRALTGAKADAPKGQKTTPPTGQKTITVEQTRSPARRPAIQEATLIGLGLNKIGRRRTLVDTPSVRGMISKVAHMVRVIDEG